MVSPEGMTPQSNFMLLAPIAIERLTRLRDLLASMNAAGRPCRSCQSADPLWRIRSPASRALCDSRRSDVGRSGRCRLAASPLPRQPRVFRRYRRRPRNVPRRISVVMPAAGLRQIFACCKGFDAEVDLLDWMRRHNQQPAAAYVNCIGRTVRQIREEDALYKAVAGYLDARAAELAGQDPQRQRSMLVSFVDAQRQAGKLSLSPPDATPPAWRISNLLNLVGVPVALLAGVAAAACRPALLSLSAPVAGVDGSGDHAASRSGAHRNAGRDRGSRRHQSLPRLRQPEARRCFAV